MPLEINLLPEFGWSIRNHSVYGPGSVFQGFVKFNLSSEQVQKADRLRIVFHASESTYNYGYVKPIYNSQLFGTQRILWKRKDLQTPLGFEPGSDISIPFIVQLPMVQFPPSANVVSESEGLSYHSNFTLSAYLDQHQGECIIKAHKTIIYMPFIETSISKKPITITTLDKPSSMMTQNYSSSSSSDLEHEQASPSINLSMSSLDYVLGDTIPLTLSFKSIPRKSIDDISIRLFQVQTWNKASSKGKTSKSNRKLKECIAQTTIKLPTADLVDISDQIKTCLDIPRDALPTFTYSSVFSVTYVLLISVKRKGKLWSNTVDLNEVPIKIGTLGYGIRSSEEIQLYSTFKSVFDQDNSTTNTLPVPKFLDIVEYEESLPVYVKDRLPAYDTIIKPIQYTNCIM